MRPFLLLTSLPNDNVVAPSDGPGVGTPKVEVDLVFVAGRALAYG